MQFLDGVTLDLRNAVPVDGAVIDENPVLTEKRLLRSKTAEFR